MNRILALALIFGASACVGEKPAPAPVETTAQPQIDEACYASCEQRAEYAHHQCLRRGGSPEDCAATTTATWEACHDRCDGVDSSCRDRCVDRGKRAFRACVRSGQSRARCAVKARRKTARCTSRHCVDEPPRTCERRCREGVYDDLQRCLDSGRRPAQCGRRASQRYDACVERACRPRTCEDLDCGRGERCEMTDGGPNCRPATCDDVRCARNERCEMTDDGPHCRPATCDDVRCARNERCEMTQEGPHCRPATCDDVRCARNERCEMTDDGPNCRPATCDDVRCTDDERCEMTDEGPHCRPATCEDIECPRGQRCHVNDDGPACRPLRCDDVDCGDQVCEMTDLGPQCRLPTCDDVECPQDEYCVMENQGPACIQGRDADDCSEMCTAEGNAIWDRCRADGRGIEECSGRASDHMVRCGRACRDPRNCQRDTCGADEMCVLGFDDRAVCRNVVDAHCVSLCEDDADRFEQDCRDAGDDWEECAVRRAEFVRSCAGECMGNHLGCGDLVCPNTHHCQEWDGHPICVPDQRPGCITGCQNNGTEAYEQCVRDERPNPECEELADQVIRDCVQFCPAQPRSCGELDRCPNNYRCHDTTTGPVCLDAPPQCAWGCHVLRENEEAACVYHRQDEPFCEERALLGFTHCIRECRENR